MLFWFIYGIWAVVWLAGLLSYCFVLAVMIDYSSKTGLGHRQPCWREVTTGRPVLDRQVRLMYSKSLNATRDYA